MHSLTLETKGSMQQVKPKIWMIWALILFIAGLLADYYFLHILFREKKAGNNGSAILVTPPETTPNNSLILTEVPDTGKDNFLITLQQCAPEIAAQAISTPDALFLYLRKSVGVITEDNTLENYNIILPNGSARRIEVLPGDKNNQLRYFEVNAHGVSKRLPLEKNQKLQQLLSQGILHNHRMKTLTMLKDGSQLDTEIHDNKVYEFQYNNHGKILSCRYTECRCL